MHAVPRPPPSARTSATARKGAAARATRPPPPASGVLPLDLWVPGPGVELLRGLPPGLAEWLTAPALPTERAAAVQHLPFRLRVLDQRVGFLGRNEMDLLAVGAAACYVHETELVAGEEPWAWSETLVPDATLELHPWLAELGATPLSTALAGMSRLERGPLEYASLPAAHPLAVRALRNEDTEPDFVWARRGWFGLGAHRLLVQEVFLPALLESLRP